MSDVFVRAAATWTADRGAPTAALIPAPQRRRCSLATRIVAEVTGMLVDQGLPLRDAAIVHGTGFGEIVTTAELLDMMRDGDGALSPMRFAGSVHNTACGQLSIAQGHTGTSTTVSAGAHTLAAAWVESMGLLTEHEHVLLVVADEPMPASMPPHQGGLAVGLWLSRTHGPPCVATARWVAPQRNVVAAPRVPAPLLHNPVRFAAPLVDALGQSTTVRLEPDDARGCAASLVLGPP